MIEQFQVLSDAFAHLRWEERQGALNVIQANYNENRFFVAFIGHYSAGKSMLINNLLGKKILPTGVRETTPLLTYIRYSAFECGRLYYTDGTVREISLEDVGTVTQNSEKWNLTALDHLEIFVDAPILRSGMIFLDTPGINTVIERHQQLLSMSLSLASRIVFVVGQSPHKSDLDTMKDLRNHTCELAFVRTHFDEIKTSEEDPQSVICHDVSLAEKCGIEKKYCFHLSNLPESKWYSNLDQLLSLFEDDGRNMRQTLEQATAWQLATMHRDCIAALEEKRTVLESIKAGDDQACAKKIAEIEKKIAHFDKSIESQTQQLRNDLNANRSAIQTTIRRNAEYYLDNAVEAIEQADNSVQTPENMLVLMNGQTKAIFRRILNDINAAVTPILAKAYDDLESIEPTLDYNLLPSVTSYTEVVQAQNYRQQHLSNQLRYLRDNRNEIEEQLQALLEDPAYDSLQSDLVALERELQSMQNDYNSIPAYVPQMIQVEDGKMQPSQIAKTIGSIADWALLLIPGSAISGAISNVAKSSKTVSKIAKVIGSSEKIAKIIQDTDKAKDIIFALNNMSKTYATKARKEKVVNLINNVATGTENVINSVRRAQEQNPSSFFDFLSVEYWAERIGKKLDRPPKMVVDEEYERQYYEAKSTVEKALRDRQQKSYEMKCRQQFFLNEQEKLNAQRKASIVDEQAVLQELEVQESAIRASAQKAAQKQWKQACGQWYRNQLSEQIHNLLNQQLASMSERIEQHYDESIQPLRSQLIEAKEAYTDLLQNQSIVPEDLLLTTTILERLKEFSS